MPFSLSGRSKHSDSYTLLFSRRKKGKMDKKDKVKHKKIKG
jgi:hypothetical protein